MQRPIAGMPGGIPSITDCSSASSPFSSRVPQDSRSPNFGASATPAAWQEKQ